MLVLLLLCLDLGQVGAETPEVVAGGHTGQPGPPGPTLALSFLAFSLAAV